MTYTTYDTPASIVDGAPEALRAAAEAAARTLPATQGILAQQPRVLAERTPLPGAPGSQAVSVAVTGVASGTVTFVVADDVAEALRSGPLGADELTSALSTPLMDAVAELESVFGGALHVGIAEAIIADALDFAADALAVSLHDGDTPVATLVIELAAEGATPAAQPPAGDAAAFTAFLDEPTEPAARSLELLHDVEMAVTVELGRTRMAVRDLLSLAPGAVVELDRAAGSPVDVLVNGKLIARGEVVVIDDDFGIRISEIIGLQPGRA